MFRRHVSKELSAYLHGELSAVDARRVASHLQDCARCQKEFDEIKLGGALAASLHRVAAPDALWGEIEAQLKGVQIKRERAVSPPAARPWFPAILAWPPVVAVCAALLVVSAAGFAWLYLRPARPPAWTVARIAGTPITDSGRINKTGRLAVGEWLETDGASRARIKVADIGEVEVGPNSRVRLVATRATEHRLALARGRLEAQINAPPRLFIVDTPTVTAVDYGCAYTLEVDDTGGSILHVTAGWVALETKDRESFVPAGAVCETRPGKGPGTPYFDDVSPEFREALKKFDFEDGGAASLDVVLSETRLYDTLTLWHLLRRVDEDQRGRIYDHMAELVPPPPEVTREGIIQLNPHMLALWRGELEGFWE
jgi:hypothetical protein